MSSTPDVRTTSNGVTGSGFRNVADPEAAVRYRELGYWGDITLSDRVSELVDISPGAEAFVTDGGRVTWAGYDDAAWKVFEAIVGAGIEPGERVAVLLPDGASVHAALLGAERAGVTAVGLGIRAGVAEVHHVVSRTGAIALVSHEHLRGAATSELYERLGSESDVHLRHHIVVPDFAAAPTAPILVDGVESPLVDDDTIRLSGSRRIEADDLWMINSTSGTTGLPKCVMHTQNRWMYFHRKAAEFGDLDTEVVLGAVPAPFGFGLWTSHFTPALLGAPTVTMERFSPELALELIERERVTVLCCVSTQFLLMMNSPRFASTDFSSLRVMFTGGEAVPLEQSRRWEAETDSLVLQFFGSNETGLLSGTTTRDNESERLETCGAVVPEMQVRLFDDGEDVTASGLGQPGCKGPATCVGYLDDDEANATLFTDDGWMLMGDISELDDDGYLRVVGRKSDIIIRGGKNISAAEVERYANAHPSVALAAAVAAPDEVFGERVCLYLQLTDGSDFEPDLLAVRDHFEAMGASRELIPEYVVVLPELPRSSGAKVAKGALREDAAQKFGSAHR